MSLNEVADRLILSGSIEGNVFPKSERDVLFPLTIKPNEGNIIVKGSVYARSIDVEAGDVIIHGPIASRGDILIHTNEGLFQAQAGITTLAGLVIGEKSNSKDQLVRDCQQCRAMIKGDINSNQSIVLNNCIVFGSIKSVNCTLTNSIVLGTIHCEDHLNVQMSSIGGYVSRDVSFEGICTMFNALGESLNRPHFLPYEDIDGNIIISSIHLYPALRDTCGMRITQEMAEQSPLSLLYEDVDWIRVAARNTDESDVVDEFRESWVLSIGGRIADYSKLSEATNALSELLRVGFEFTHYSANTKREQLEKIRSQLTASEQAVLDLVCI